MDIGIIIGILSLIGVVPTVYLFFKNQVKKSQERFVNVRTGIRQHRPDMTVYALKFLGKRIKVAPRAGLLNYLVMLTPTSRLQQLDDVDIRFAQRVDQTKQLYYGNDYFRSMTANILPAKAPFVKFERMSQAVEAIQKPSIFSDRCAYRLLLVKETEGRLQLFFDASHEFSYFDQLNFHSLLEYELADAFYRRKWKLTDNDIPDLQLRDWATNRMAPSNFSRFDEGLFFLGISAALILVKDGKFRLLLHERGHLGTVAGTIHLIPSGEFQPVNSDVSFTEDFNLWHSIIREYCEEIRGDKEVSGNNARSINYDKGKYKLISEMIPPEDRYFLGLGLDPVTYKAELLACLVVPYDKFKQTLPGDTEAARDQFVRSLERNEEGLIIGEGDDDLGIEFSDHNNFEKAEYYLKEPRTLNATKMALTLLKQHYQFLSAKYLGK